MIEMSQTFSLRVQGLLLTRGGKPSYSLSIPDLCLLKGQRYSLLGASGSGKSTAMDLFSMILHPSKVEEFTLMVDGKLVSIQSAWKKEHLDAFAWYRSKYIGYVLQTGGLMPFLSVQENILLSRDISGHAGKGKLEYLTRRLGIHHLLHKKIDEISIGERQRVCVARALIHEPTLVLADEPTAALDPYTARGVMDLLAELSEEFGATLLIATHDWQSIRKRDFIELGITLEKSEESIQATLALS